MTTDELNAIVQAVMSELEKAGVDFDFKAETPQADDLVYVMRGTADRYMGITVKWQNLLDIIVKKATDAKNEAVSAKDIALQTLATIQGIESNISTMKSSVETSEANVASMKASVETSEANVTQMKSDVSTMKASVEGTKTEVENIKKETAGLLNTKADKTYVDGELAKKVNYTDSLSYEEIMATTDLTNKVASASALNTLGTKFNYAKAEQYTLFKSLVSQVTVLDYARCIRFGNYFSIILPISVSSTIPSWTKIVQIPITAKVETMGWFVPLSGKINGNTCPMIHGDDKVEITNTLDPGTYFIYLVGAVK